MASGCLSNPTICELSRNIWFTVLTVGFSDRRERLPFNGLVLVGDLRIQMSF